VQQARAGTLAAGGVIAPLSASTPEPVAFIATMTQVAVLNEWTPVVEEDPYGVEMVRVPAGCFMMGSIFLEDELPVHEVCFGEPFWIDRYEVTNAQLARLDGVAEEESTWPEPNRPRTDITWYEARRYYAEQRGARLPNKAEWEYAARGPDSLVYPWGNEFVGDNLVYGGNSGWVTAEIGSRPAGMSWVGAHDMSGNVGEWTTTIYDQERYLTLMSQMMGVKPIARTQRYGVCIEAALSADHTGHGVTASLASSAPPSASATPLH
jgi:formylglycine-generating enzyme required for sulfatase activity